MGNNWTKDKQGTNYNILFCLDKKNYSTYSTNKREVKNLGIPENRGETRITVGEIRGQKYHIWYVPLCPTLNQMKGA
jgi:hypothetical protein